MAVNTWKNSDGLLVRFGRDQGLRGARASVTTDTTKTVEMVIDVVLTGAARTIFSSDLTNDGTTDGFSAGLDTPIPNGAFIKDVTVLTIVAPAGGTNYAVGTYQVDGTPIDDDGIRTTAPADGALIGTQVAQDEYVAVKTTGTYTAGELKIVIKYLMP